jgi:Tetracyclin repressor-like, C-terminal domain
MTEVVQRRPFRSPVADLSQLSGTSSGVNRSRELLHSPAQSVRRTRGEAKHQSFPKPTRLGRSFAQRDHRCRRATAGLSRRGRAVVLTRGRTGNRRRPSVRVLAVPVEIRTPARSRQHAFSELQRYIEKATSVHTDPRARVRAHCLAYCDYGLISPGHYRLLFESRLTTQLGIGYQGSPGARVFECFVDTVRQATHARTERDVRREVVVLWAGLHGIVSLRWNKPGFPWPEVGSLVDRLLAALKPCQ